MLKEILKIMKKYQKLAVTAALVMLHASLAFAAVNGKEAPYSVSLTHDGGDATISWSEPSWDGIDKYEVELDRIREGSGSNSKYKSKTVNAGEDTSVDISITTRGYYAARVRAKDVSGSYTAWSGLSNTISVTSEDIRDSGSSGGPYVSNSRSAGPGVKTSPVVSSPSGGMSGPGAQSGGAPSGELISINGPLNSGAAPGNGAQSYGWSSQTVTSKAVVANTYTSAGWQSDGHGRWYLDPNGTYPVSTWRLIDGKHYHFNEYGYVDWNRWIKENNGSWYFCTAEGVMATGWNNVSGEWYYMDPANGQTLMGGEHVIDGKVYVMQASGANIRDAMYNGHYYGPDGARKY